MRTRTGVEEVSLLLLLLLLLLLVFSMCFRPLFTWVLPCLTVGWLPPSGRVDYDIDHTPYVIGYARFDLTAPQAILCGFDNGRAGYYEY